MREGGGGGCSSLESIKKKPSNVADADVDVANMDVDVANMDVDVANMDVDVANMDVVDVARWLLLQSSSSPVVDVVDVVDVAAAAVVVAVAVT